MVRSFSSSLSRGENKHGAEKRRNITTNIDFYVCWRSQLDVYIEQEIRRDEMWTLRYQMLSKYSLML